MRLAFSLEREHMKATPTKDVHLNSRTIQQPRWHGYELRWFIEKMNWQIRKAGIRDIPIPWKLKN
jgi:hypothetical protein